MNNNPSVDITATNPGILPNMLNDVANDLNLTGVRWQFHGKQNPWTVDFSGSATGVVDWTKIDFTKTYNLGSGEPTMDLVKLADQVVNPFLTRVAANGFASRVYVDPIFPSSTQPSFWWSNSGKYATFALTGVLWLKGLTPLSHPATPIAVDRWAIVNEPDNAAAQSAMAINSKAAAVSALFATNNISTKIQIPEMFQLDANFVLSAAGGLTNVGVISTHAYDYRDNTQPSAAQIAARNSVRATAQGIGALTAATEICCWSNSVWTSTEIAALAAARDIYWSMTELGVSDYQYFGTWFNPPGTFSCTNSVRQGNLIFLAHDLSAYFKCANYYVIRQYSHWIHPGYVRVAATCSGCGIDPSFGLTVKPVAFRSPGGKIVVVVMNDQSASQAISLAGLPAGSYDIVGVDPSNSTSPVTYPVQTIGAGQSLSLTFPAQAIVTFAQR
ncbi:MAG TPA: glycoside hydrolase family 30 beta sandwich domain-containing protein [Candidatus Acidoferrales bacterium]|nr:glycoside hydrolase family 30 beta sandwich domain-containing protein [Candidatus Acidoferrales bacterium]